MSQIDFQQIAQQLRQPEGDLGRQVGETMNTSNAIINQLAIEYLHIQPHDHILEIGMGNGYFVSELLSTYSKATYTGVDFSETMVTESIQRNQHFMDQARATFVLASADQMPIQDSVFDKVFTINTIYFWEHPAEVLAEIYRVMKPGASLLIGIRSKESMLKLPFTQYGFRLYDGCDVKELLLANGFEVQPLIEYNEPPQHVAGEPIELQTVLIIGTKKPT